MTTLINRITIEAPRQAVWQVLSNLELLDHYDPGVRSSRLLDGPDAGDDGSARSVLGLGATRRCDLRPRGWFVERVVRWQPDQALAFDLVTCSLPVHQLRHDYTLTETGAIGGTCATTVTQTMTYQLKYGLAGRLLDALVVRRQFDRGIKAFLRGLSEQVRSGRPATASD